VASEIDMTPGGTYYRNNRLRHEIIIHQEQQAQTRNDVDMLMKEREMLMEKKKITIDGRRNVLNLQDCMTCTPEMNFGRPCHVLEF
jgi:hypothetical protein